MSRVFVPGVVAAWVLAVQATWGSVRFCILLFGAVMVVWFVYEQIAKRRHS
jgi:membrane-bound metal-dependent hydrolase YbcI (DUF457 family)